MKAFSFVPVNFEDIALKELKEILGKKGNKKKGFILFDFKSYKELVRFCYLTQSSKRVLVLLFDFAFSSKKDFLKKAREKINKLRIPFLDKIKTFRVSSEGFPIVKINEFFGELLSKKMKKEGKRVKVNLNEPDLVFYAHITNKHCYFGIDFSGDLEKRDYRVFNSQNSIKGPLAYCLVRMSDFTQEKVLLDCFCTSGEIPIEAAFFSSKKSVHFANKEKFNFLKFFPSYLEELENLDKKEKKSRTNVYALGSRLLGLAKQNAVIAKVKINFSQRDISWLDTKFKNQEVDCIVSRIIEESKRNKEKDVMKVYKEFFYNANYILNKKGVIVLLLRKTNLLETIAKQYEFKIKEKRKIYLGKAPFFAIVFIKQKKQ